MASASRHLSSAPAPDSAGGAGQFSTATPRPSYTDHHEGGTRGSFESNRVMHGDSPAQTESTKRDFLGGATETSSAGGAGNISNTDFPPSPAPESAGGAVEISALTNTHISSPPPLAGGADDFAKVAGSAVEISAPSDTHPQPSPFSLPFARGTVVVATTARGAEPPSLPSAGGNVSFEFMMATMMAQFQSAASEMDNLKTALKSDRQSGLQSMQKLTADLGSDLQTMNADLHAEMTTHGSSPCRN